MAKTFTPPGRLTKPELHQRIAEAAACWADECDNWDRRMSAYAFLHYRWLEDVIDSETLYSLLQQGSMPERSGPLASRWWCSLAMIDVYRTIKMNRSLSAMGNLLMSIWEHHLTLWSPQRLNGCRVGTLHLYQLYLDGGAEELMQRHLDFLVDIFKLGTKHWNPAQHPYYPTESMDTMRTMQIALFIARAAGLEQYQFTDRDWCPLETQVPPTSKNAFHVAIRQMGQQNPERALWR